MARRDPTPVRFDPTVAARLSTWVSAHPGLSLSAAANRLVDEALRTEEHPGITFRPGVTGRRAGLTGGPDVWEVIRSVRSARAAEPDLIESEVLALVATNTGLTARVIGVAVDYWARFPAEIDAAIQAEAVAADVAEAAWQRRQDMLRRR